METGQERVNTIEEEILRYLLERPHAADTIDGIRQWWLPRIRLDAATSEIKQALEHLVLQGKVVASELPDGNIVFKKASP